MTENSFESIWGQMPSNEEVTESLQWHCDERLRRLSTVLAGCLTPIQLAHNFNLPLSTDLEIIKDERMIVIDLGEAGKFIPAWQFDSDPTDSVADVTIDPNIGRLWERARPNMSALSFAQFMTLPWRRSQDTPLEIVANGNYQAVELIAEYLDGPRYM